MDFFFLLRSCARAYLGPVLALLVFQAVSTLAILYLPTLNARIIDEGVATGDVALIWRLGGLMLAVALVQVLCACAAVWFGARTAMGTGRDLRDRVYQQVTRFSAGDVGRFSAATLITRGTNDVQQIQMTLLILLNIAVPVPIMMIGGIVMAIREDPGLSWLMAVSVVVLLGAAGAVISALVPLFTKMQGRIDAINAVLREQIAGIRVVRAFAREGFEAERFEAANHDITRLSLRIGNLFVVMFPMFMLILNVATAAVVWFGGGRVDSGAMEVGSLTAFMQYLLQILASVMMGGFVAMLLPRALVCATRVREVLDHSPSIAEPQVPAPLIDAPASPTATPAVELREVTFSYPGASAPVLDQISLTARAGQTTAIIGSTGAGKTTLLSLIPRLYAPTSGQVLVAGRDVATLTRAQLATEVAMVPQRAYLFSGTVASNLRLADPSASDERCWEALEIAQAAGFVRSHELGLDMPIAQGGTNVSGGQRQRLCIARALIGEPKVLLFDDSFSALDVLTDARVREALAPRTRHAAVIVVAQRVASIRDADVIAVLEAGRIVARGTHAELLDTSTTYQEIVRSQLTEEVR